MIYYRIKPFPVSSVKENVIQETMNNKKVSVVLYRF